MQDNFDVKHFLEITFDIMEKVAAEFKPKKEEINAKSLQIGEKMFEYQNLFRTIISKYQQDMFDKYGISITEYNENAAIYKNKIEDYLEDSPEENFIYKSIKDRLKFTYTEPLQNDFDEVEKNEQGQKKPSRFPLGKDSY